MGLQSKLVFENDRNQNKNYEKGFDFLLTNI